MWKQQQFLYTESIKTSWDQGLFHSEMYPANTTVKWLDTDTIENATNDSDISYTFNEHGFRSDSFSKRSDINIITSGCSNTVGVGIDQHESWPFVLQKLVESHTNKTVSIWNLATSGASADYVSRTIVKTVDILKPDFVCVYWPPISRIEAPDGDRHTRTGIKVKQTLIRDNDFPKPFVNEDWLDYYYQKNFRLCKSVSYVAGAEFVSNDTIEARLYSLEGSWFSMLDTSARDGMHPGPKWHRAGAEYYFNFIKGHI